MISNDNPIFYRILECKRELTIKEYCKIHKLKYYDVLFELLYGKPLHEILGLEENKVKHIRAFATEMDLDVTTVSINKESLNTVPTVESIDWKCVYDVM